MKGTIKLLLITSFLFYVICAGFVSPSYAEDTGGPKVGTMAKNFSLKDMSGKTVELKSYKGKKAVLLVFWSVGWGACIQEVPELNELYAEYKGKNFELLTINSDETIEEVQQVIKDEGIKYRVLLDPENSTGDPYNIMYIPLNVLVDINGKVVYSEAGELPSTDLIDKALKK